MYGDFRSTKLAIAPQRRVEPLVGEHHGERRLGVDHRLPGPDIESARRRSRRRRSREELGRGRDRTACRCARSAIARAASIPPHAVGDLDVLGELRDPRRDGTSSPASVARPALAVPLLVRRRQRAHADLGQTELARRASGQHGVLGEHAVDVVASGERELDARSGTGAAADRRRRAGAARAHASRTLAARSRTCRLQTRCRRRTTSPARGRRCGSRR